MPLLNVCVFSALKFWAELCHLFFFFSTGLFIILLLNLALHIFLTLILSSSAQRIFSSFVVWVFFLDVALR